MQSPIRTDKRGYVFRFVYLLYVKKSYRDCLVKLCYFPRMNLALCFLITFTYCGLLFSSEIQEFSLKTFDGKAVLSGQIDFPNSDDKSFPLVIMQPGTGLFDRDVDFGNTDDENSLIFKSISSVLLKAGFAVLRYDYRGVKCSFQTMPKCFDCADKKAVFKFYLDSCISNEIRGTVTPSNIQEDLLLAYQFAASNSKIDMKKVIMFGHSEGSIHISNLVKNSLISPLGIIFMGGLAESPASAIEWQMKGRVIDGIMQMDKNSDGRVENKEVEENHQAGVLKIFPLKMLLSPDGFWTKESITSLQTAKYSEFKKSALMHADDEPYAANGITQASYKWWKMFFEDENTIIDNLIKFPGRTVYFAGKKDSQTDYLRQTQIIESYVHKLLVKPEVIAFESLGHSLGSNPLVGPVDHVALEKIVETALRILKE